MFKNMIVIVMLVVVVVSISGCRTIPAACDDVSGTLDMISEKLDGLKNDANKRDSERDARKLAKYHAEQAGLYASYDNDEVQ